MIETRLPVLACDPGITGAFALLVPDGNGVRIRTADFPTIKEGKKTVLDLPLLFALVRSLAADAPDAIPIIEKVWAIKGQGITSAFSFGRTYGELRMAMSMVLPALELVTPQRWKKDWDLIGKDKEADRLLALSAFPSARSSLQRKKDHNRADAILIAGWRGNYIEHYATP
jgi:crossover junction endodeoxyribonuclease RuvC